MFIPIWGNSKKETKIPQHYQRETVEGIVKRSNKEGNQHIQYLISGAIGEVIVSVFVLLGFHLLNLKYITMYTTTSLLIYFMFVTLKIYNNITIILYLIKYPVTYQFSPSATHGSSA